MEVKRAIHILLQSTEEVLFLPGVSVTARQEKQRNAQKGLKV